MPSEKLTLDRLLEALENFAPAARGPALPPLPQSVPAPMVQGKDQLAEKIDENTRAIERLSGNIDKQPPPAPGTPQAIPALPAKSSLPPAVPAPPPMSSPRVPPAFVPPVVQSIAPAPPQSVPPTSSPRPPGIPAIAPATSRPPLPPPVPALASAAIPSTVTGQASPVPRAPGLTPPVPLASRAVPALPAQVQASVRPTLPSVPPIQSPRLPSALPAAQVPAPPARGVSAGVSVRDNSDMSRTMKDLTDAVKELIGALGKKHDKKEGKDRQPWTGATER